jgi:GDP-4-dehydro-6-deoxy-D-mannose reductase
MRIFVTGAAGFAGSHLVRELLSEGHEVFGLVFPAESRERLPGHESFREMVGDVTDIETLTRTMGEAAPERVYHLAGQASPAASWSNPFMTFSVNTGGTANLLEAARICGGPRVIVVTSGLIYGSTDANRQPITERSSPQPVHPYGISKWAAGKLAKLYWKRFQMPVIEVRPFNHIGPGQSLGFVVPDFASQLAAIKLGRREADISVGNLTAERDFSDVRDVARAYSLLGERGVPGQTYLVCSGRAVTVEHILRKLIELSGVEVHVRAEPDLLRALDDPRIVGSYAKINRDTGWQPEITLIQSLADTLQEWISRLEQ